MKLTVEQQIENYKNGFPFLKVIAPATPEKGITVLDTDTQRQAMYRYCRYINKQLGDHDAVKFVPASGAASRMFKDLFEGRDLLAEGKSLPEGHPAARFLENIADFPFYDDSFKGLTPLQTLEKVLGADGLNYGALPKGCILFHRYEKEVMTAFEEHLIEGGIYAPHLHFTVSPEHVETFKAILEKVQPKYEALYDVKYKVEFSVQDPETDIIAVNEDNTPFLKEDGRPLFRPGGHGALLHNLNSVDGDVIFLKNIDNVINHKMIGETVRWKETLGGVLIGIREKVVDFLERLDAAEGYDKELCNEIIAFLEKVFCISVPALPENELPAYLHAKLNRPIRVCGMVKNEGEPGGGPFLVAEKDGSTSLQILESAQLDHSAPETAELLSRATHFNPVDIVCSIKDYKGEKFDLSGFVDPQAGFISSKSYQGRKLKAQELPGLWNGSMSHWNTVFIETPLITFNPVKTVLDLLRREHLGR